MTSTILSILIGVGIENASEIVLLMTGRKESSYKLDIERKILKSEEKKFNKKNYSNMSKYHSSKSKVK
jgi:hypothetical protein